jgi:glycosyltransferase involved in cell wall biosynthesis
MRMSDADIAPVTAVVPCYRAMETVGRAVASIAAQTVRPAEVMLIDDASDDDTLSVLHALACKYPPGWIQVIALEENSGPGAARNAGWECATQPWLAFLDADDAWHPRKLELQFAVIRQHREVMLCGHDTALAPADGRYPEVPLHPVVWRVGFQDMFVSNRFPTRSVLLRRDLGFRFAGKDVCEDYLLWLKVLKSKHACYRIEAPLAVSFRRDSSPGGYSGSLWRHENRELAAWRALHRERAISWPTLFAAMVWSLLKYARRVVRRAMDRRGTGTQD